MIDWTSAASGRRLLGSIRSEFLRYKSLAEEAIEQVRDDELALQGTGEPGSITSISWHIGGNLRSRFTDFLTSDGEKPWRHRETEFDNRTASRAELLAQWQIGWDALLNTLNELSDNQLDRDITIRGQTLKVHEALHRSLAHTAYHVGQIVYVAKAFRGSDWKSLSIPRGQSDAYNANPTKERAKTH